MIVFIIEVQKSKTANFKSVNLTNLSQIAKLIPVYIFTL